MKLLPVRFKFLICFVAIIGATFGIGVHFAEIDTDITRFLPRNEPVLADASAIFRLHPMRDQVAVDLYLEKEDRELLLRCGRETEALLKKSGLFKSVGLESFQGLMPGLVEHTLTNLPVLFSESELKGRIAERMQPEALENRFQEMRKALFSLDGIGRASHMERDPLGLADLVIARLASLAPTMDAQIHRGKLLSADGRHLLVLARPAISGTDTAFAKKLGAEMDRTSANLTEMAEKSGNRMEMTPVGAYRAALDNETIVRKDVNRAIVIATFGIALLLIFSFHRPFVGLLAFLPALAGTAASFMFCALFFPSLSIMALGFGGAIISITVDHGIAYLLFLDQPWRVTGKEASEKLRSVGLIAALTTMGAFGLLCFSAFPVFRQLGLFTALGIGFSFVFVHTIFPKLFPVMPPAEPRSLPLRKIAPLLASGGKKVAWLALFLGTSMLFFARPEFNVELSAMNTVSTETKAAETLVTKVWGDRIFKQVYLVTEGESPQKMRAVWDRLMKQVENDKKAGVVESAFVPSMFFPGEEVRKENFTAWRSFWRPERIRSFREALALSAVEAGFKPDAFESFFKMLAKGYEDLENREMPEEFFELSSIRKKDDGSGWSQFSILSPGPAYDPEKFYETYRVFGPVFDADLFSKRLGRLLFDNFTKMLVVIGAGVALLLFIFFLDWKLTALGLLPVLFAMSCALGVMKLIGHPLDIPGLMLSIVVFGMGIDYSLYVVRAFQRTEAADHPDTLLIETGVFMAASSTLIGFGVLVFSEHSLLKSAGLTSLLGIAFASAGTFAILPPLLSSFYRRRERRTKDNEPIERRIAGRYKKREAYPRLFARFKIKFDPMFSELPRILKDLGQVDRVLDVGCGYGVPAAWLLEYFPEATVYGFDPDRERVRVAELALGERGRIQYGYAPEIPELPEPMDAVFILDIIHFLTDRELERTLAELARRMRSHGRLVVRAVIPPVDGKYSRTWRLEALKMKIAGVSPAFRSVEKISRMIEEAGFRLEYTELSGGNVESSWFIAKRSY